MEAKIYGKKMVVADLIIASIWALFTIRYSLWGAWPALVYILMRIALCFEMRRKSPWVLYSGIAFTLCYLEYMWGDGAIYPFKRLAYYIGAWIGNGKDVVDAFGGELDQDLKVWLYCFSSLLGLWLIGVPLITGIVQNNIKKINWKKKWIWGYIIISLILGAWITYYEPRAGAVIEGMMLGFLPVIYWSKYNRANRSAIEIAMNNTAFVTYVSFIVLYSLCIFIGMEELDFLKGIALLTIPPIFYVLICKSSGFKALTRHAIALSMCGILYSFIFTAPLWFKIITLSISGIFALYVAIDMGGRNHTKWTGLGLFVLTTGIVCPTILGINPYAALDAYSVSKFYYGYYACDGVYVIEKDGKYGLRDRFGLILEPKYERFARLDKWGRYISTNTCNGSMIADNRYGIYDVAKQEFLLDPESVAVAQLVQVSENSFHLLDPSERHFATLLLRGYHPEKNDYIQSTIIEPYSEPAELTLEEDPYYAKFQEEHGECQHSENMGAYELCDKARVNVNRRYKEIIDSDSTYRKVYDRWSNLMESMSDYLINVTYGEPFYSMQPIQFNHDIRQWYEFMAPEVRIDKDIISHETDYTSSVKSISSGAIDSFFYKFKPTKPGGYNRMWNEIKPAFFEWQFARAKYAERMEDPHQRLSYEEHTNYLTNYYFKEIQGLVETRNDNVIWDREHPDGK